MQEVLRRVLSVLRRILEAGTLEPEREERGAPAMRGQGTSGKMSVGKCTLRGPLPAKGTETTYRGTRSARGARGRCCRQRRKGRGKLGTWAQGGSKPIPATEGRQYAGRGLEAQAGPIGRDGTPKAPRNPGPGVRAALTTRGEDLSTKKAPGEAHPRDPAHPRDQGNGGARL